MKQLFYNTCLFFTLTIFSGCIGNENVNGVCTIRGKMENYKKAKLQLFEITLSKNYFVSKVEVDNDGDFELQFNAKEKSIYGIQFRNTFIYFINDVPEININTSENEFENYFSEGSKETEALRQLILTEKRLATEKVIANKLLYNKIVKTDAKIGNNPELLNLENKSDKAEMELRNYITEYIDSTTNKLLAIAACSFLNMNEDYNYLRLFSERIKKSDVNPKQKNDLKLELDKISDGFKYIAPIKRIKAVNTDGKEIALENFTGKYVFLNIWATWCFSSRTQLPFIIDVYNRHKGNNEIEFINVAIDEDTTQWKKFLSETPFIIKNNLCDPFGNEASILKRFGVDYIPTNFILDKRGNVLTTNLKNKDIGYVIDSVLKSKIIE
jgi:thiol-disulfide isomerase/thioredoxin